MHLPHLNISSLLGGKPSGTAQDSSSKAQQDAAAAAKPKEVVAGVERDVDHSAVRSWIPWLAAAKSTVVKDAKDSVKDAKDSVDGHPKEDPRSRHVSTCDVVKLICTLVLAAAFLAPGLWTTWVFIQFTPLHRDITCTIGSGLPEKLEMGMPGFSSTKFGFKLGFNCNNPNPYDVSFEYSTPGGVFIGKDRIKVGTAMQTPYSDSFFPAHGQGSVSTRTEVEITPQMLQSLFPELITSKGIPMFLSLNQTLGFHIEFRLFKFRKVYKFRTDVIKNCGMMLAGVAGVLSTQGKPGALLGPIACANSFDDLKIPDFSDGTTDGTIALSAGLMASDKLGEASRKKNLVLGSAMGVFLGGSLGLFFLFYSQLRDHDLVRQLPCCSLCRRSHGPNSRDYEMVQQHDFFGSK
ncbi:unnamed protein product [Polarella glacialis]|uniref:Uncharacterized protein n=1 Tax=Polarella glacialis TaxID=89957 RepID=A0A813GZW1_POLGL|nr:unnamed protein product [Polarella glacialis]|mmetsp:Transcript_76809/g.138574  ORF Transcript_76809/g.138574 Transcript_76809/m.138574 type:complete len:406 (-) Transcript_76809:104-1321(-)|eukprot:CAMPEP_0115153892 /NCGR_PEP_ID=MMETSP0227-20121206/66981_1 /TAXON_ID=89957 /ORGANISM="Polarella glacialis, Strain CCMP 1383" /LENGTH=405 /DNA_ID=CAMNT_0002564687 /DNA_START=25 /DNA_END=1242 /DNA_ORIENTATION=-